MDEPPFQTNLELCSNLYIPEDRLPIRWRPKSVPEPPIPLDDATQKNYLPGQPRIPLQGSRIVPYLERDLLTNDLNKLAPRLWLIATQDSTHISSLTHQIVRGRNIILTEKPELHLVWIYDRIYIKPMPKYLLSHAFWEFYLTGKTSPIAAPLRQDVAKAALGFMRSYLFLIQHKSDFHLAQDPKLRLLPKHVSYAAFVLFIIAFEKVPDREVSPRYRFGELRLGRLNFWSKIFLRRFAYQKVQEQYGAYFAQFYGPLLFVFAVFSLSLSAMQVALAVQPSIQFGLSWVAFAQVSRNFSVFTLVCVVLIALVLFLMFAFLSLREIVYAVKDLRRQKTSKTPRDVEQIDDQN